MKLIHRIFTLTLTTLVLFSCTDKEQPTEPSRKPVMEISCALVTSESCELNFKALYADYILVLVDKEASNPSESELLSKGVRVDGLSHVATGLEGGTDYFAHAAGVAADGTLGDIVTCGFKTSSNVMYPWEKAREGLPKLADMVLCYGGSAHRVPAKWDSDRFAPMVSYVDADGHERWLFESFLAIEFADTKNRMAYALGYNGNAASKTSWKQLIDYWFEDGYGFDALEAAVADAAKRLGEPKSKRYVVMTLPDAIIYQKQEDENSTTVYWGSLNNRRMDFSKAEDRLAALYWYIDEVRARFNAKNYKYLDLCGFYIISEDLAVFYEGNKYGWSQQYKRWDEIFPNVSRYLDVVNEGVYWIPYFEAGGYELWKSLFEIDLAFMQPNHYWDPLSHSMLMFFSHISTYGMGMELEFDDKLIGHTETALQYKRNFRDYLEQAKERGVWGTKPFALYSDDNAFYNLSKSTDPSDRELFLELCDFIADNPIKTH